MSTTGKEAASAAGRVLNDPKSSPDERKVAASALQQAKVEGSQTKILGMTGHEWGRLALACFAVALLLTIAWALFGCSTPQASTTVTPGEASAKSSITTTKFSIQTPEAEAAPVYRVRIIPPPKPEEPAK